MKKLKELKDWLQTAFLSKKNFFRDLFIISITIFLAGLLVGSNYYTFSFEKRKIKKQTLPSIERKNALALSEEEIYQEIKNLQETINTSQWKTYNNRWYGIALKYPTDWQSPILERKTSNNKWEARYRFEKLPNFDQIKSSVFFLTIYENSKIKSLFETEEFPVLKENSSDKITTCQNIQGHIIETGDYPAEEIYIGPEDDCYQPTLFFSFTQGNYFFVLSVKKEDFFSEGNDPHIEITNNFPEFFSIASTMEIVDIVRPKPNPPKLKISAPIPVSYKRDALNRLICDKKNDKPHKSDKNKKKHSRYGMLFGS